MFKIFYGVLLFALILIVSIACSTTTDDSVSDVEFYKHVQQYNKLLTHTSELESKITDLENSLSQLEERHSLGLIKITDIFYRVDDEIKANAEWIEINDSKIFENEQNIKANAKKIESNEENITYRIDHIIDKIDFNEKQIKMNTDAIEEFCDEYLSDIWEIIETPSRWRECYVLTGRGN